MNEVEHEMNEVEPETDESVWEEQKLKWKRAAPVILGCLTVILLLLGAFVFLLWRGCSSGGEKDTVAPVITNVNATEIGIISATINWTTNEDATGQVEYGTTENYGLLSTKEIILTNEYFTNHSLSLTGLEGSTEYHYRVISKDHAGNEAISDDYTFTTLPDPVVTFEDPYFEALIRGRTQVIEGDVHASDMLAIERLEAANSNITDITGLEYCTNLTYLDLSRNNIVDVSPLEGLTKLGPWIVLNDNQIVDILPMANNPGLGQGDYIYLGNNPLSPTSELTGINALRARGATVYYRKT